MSILQLGFSMVSSGDYTGHYENGMCGKDQNLLKLEGLLKLILKLINVLTRDLLTWSACLRAFTF